MSKRHLDTDTFFSFRVKPAAFDLFLGGCIAAYLGIVYYAIQVCYFLADSMLPYLLSFSSKAQTDRAGRQHSIYQACFLEDSVCFSLTEFRLSLHKAESSSEIQAPVNKTLNTDSVTRPLKSALHMLDFCFTGCAAHESNARRRLIICTTYKLCICFEMYIVLKMFVPFIINKSTML